MVNRIQLRRDLDSSWEASDPVLAQGELGFTLDTGDVKFGDGSTPWTALAPWTPNTINGASKLVSIGDAGFGVPGVGLVTSTAGTSELVFTVGVAATGVTGVWLHWYDASGDIDTDPSGSITFSASLKVVSSTNPGTVTGTIYRLTFNGRTTVTLDPGGRIIADILGVSLAPGDVVAVRTYLSSGTAYAPRTTYGLTGWGGFTAATDLTAPGSAAISSSAGNYYGPAALLGHAEGADNAKSVLVVGDSIGEGFQDAAFWTNPALPGIGGFIIRALSGVAGVINAAIVGDKASGFQGTNGSFRRISNAPLCNSAIIQYGTNDDGSESAAQLEAFNLDIATYLRRFGIAKAFLTTLVPKTTTTDGWATTTNQTVYSSESVRVAYNTWVRGECPIDPTTKAPVAVGTSGALLVGQYGHPITGFFDVGSAVETSLNSGLWLPANRVTTGSITASGTTLTSSTANFLTADQESGGDLGTTINVIGAGAAGALLTAHVQSVLSSTQVLLDVAAGTTVTGAQINIGAATSEGVHPGAHSCYLMSQKINVAVL